MSPDSDLPALVGALELTIQGLNTQIGTLETALRASREALRGANAALTKAQNALTKAPPASDAGPADLQAALDYLRPRWCAYYDLGVLAQEVLSNVKLARLDGRKRCLVTPEVRDVITQAYRRGIPLVLVADDSGLSMPTLLSVVRGYTKGLYVPSQAALAEFERTYADPDLRHPELIAQDRLYRISL